MAAATTTTMTMMMVMRPTMRLGLQMRIPRCLPPAAAAGLNWPCLRQRRRRWYSESTKPGEEKPYYLTSPIFYVNAAPHIGHLYTLILTDILKRWQELKGRRAILTTGTDEHGLKIQQAAAAAGLEPGVFCDGGAEMFKSLAAKSNISYDHFHRTTSARHRDGVQHIWHLLQSRDLIYSGQHTGWYSVADETFYSDSNVTTVQDPATGNVVTTSIETGRPVERTSEQNYHFRLSAMREPLLAFYAANPTFVVPATRYSAVIAAVTEGLSDLSISRPSSRLTWGIPVPTDPTQTIYVWLDALCSYLIATSYPWTPGHSTGGWPADIHVIGKDILRFHCIYWPAFLLSLGLPPPRQVLTHAHWTLARRKMSKTEGNVVNPFYAMDRYGVDTMRFYMAYDGRLGDDGDYANENIVDRYGGLLQHGVGNLVGRICSKSFDLERAVRQGSDVADDAARRHREGVEAAVSRACGKMDALNVPDALKDIMSIITDTNKYITHTSPWLLKHPRDSSAQDSIIYHCAESVRVAGILLQPFMPGKAKQLLDRLGVAAERRGMADVCFGGDRAWGAGVVRTGGPGGMLFPPLNEGWGEGASESV